jgi:adenylate cyclase
MIAPLPAGPNPGGLSLRTTLVLGFGCVLLLTTAGFVVNNLYAGRKVVQSLSRTILDQASTLVEVKLEAFFGTVSGINSATAERLGSGLVAWQDWDSLRRFFLPMLQRLPQVSGVGVGDSEGNAYNLTRFGSHWRSQEIRPSAWGTNTLWKEWTPAGALVGEWWEGSAFDPRQRPWFAGAVTASRQTRTADGLEPVTPHWTSPYRFYTTGAYGVTVAARVPWERALNAVVYFDLALRDLDAFVAQAKPSPNGFSMVLNGDLEIVGGLRPRESSAAGGSGVNATAVELASEPMPLLTEALEGWRRRSQPDTWQERIRRTAGDVWVGWRTLALPGEQFHVVVVVPEADFLGEALRERRRMGLVLGLGLLLAVGLAFWLAGRYTRPIGLLVHRSAAIEQLDLSQQGTVESRVKELRQLAGAQARMSAALESFARYVPREVIRELLRQGEAARIGAHPAELTVLFSDIRGFTRLSEGLAPDRVAQYLSEYFDALHGIIARHQGTTDKFIGDALMAFWGAPRPDARHALNAVRAVLECQERLGELNRGWKAEGRPEFHTTFGLACGPVVVGNVGARDRLNYTVLGHTVNVASRCVGLARQLGCASLALETVARATAAEIEWRRLGPVTIRGLSRTAMVCEPLGPVGAVPADVVEFRRDYERALDAYLAKDIEGALVGLDALAEHRPDQLSVRYLAERCQELRRAGAGGFETDLLSFR